MSFNLAAYVAKTTKASGVPLHISSANILLAIIRHLTK